MKSLQLKNEKEVLLAEQDELANKTELSAEEKTRWEQLQDKVDKLEKEIRLEEQKENHVRNRAVKDGRDLSKSDKKDIESYSLVKALREYLGGKLTGLEAEMSQEADAENVRLGTGGILGLGIPSIVLANKPVMQRSTIVSASNPTVATTPMGFIDAVYARTLLVELGAQTMSGLTGNVDLPYMATAPTMDWQDENEAGDDAGAAFDKYTLRPKRLSNFLPVSKLLLVQTALDVERRLWDHLIRATAVKLQAGAIAGGGEKGPTGLLGTSGIGSVVGGDNGAAPTHANVLALIREVAVDNCDFGALAFLCSPLVRWKLQSTAIETGHPQRVWDPLSRDTLLGYKAGVTSLVPDNLTKGNQSDVCSAIIFGNFNEMTIGQFGAMDLTIDNITQAKNYMVNLILNAFYDVAITRPEAFAAMKDAKCQS